MSNPIIIGTVSGTPDNPQFLGSLTGSGTGTGGGGGGGGGVDTSGTFVESGCGVAWTGTGLIFVVAAGVFWVLGSRYTTNGGTVTLSTGDSSNPRVDTIAVNTSGTPVVVEGTPSVNPSKPSVDPTTQIDLTHVEVAANATTPGTTISNLTVYAENSGSPTEFTTSSSGSGWTFNSTTDPHAGTTHITGASVGTGAYAQFASSATLDINQYERLVYYIKVTSTWNGNRFLRVGWFNSGVQVGNWVDVVDGTYGFSRIAGNYIVVIIPALAFSVPAGSLVNQLRFLDAGGSINFRLDDITLQLANTGIQPVGGLTEAQADALYQKLKFIEPFNFARPIGRI